MKICFDLICYNEVYEEVELEKGYLIGHGQSYVRKINFESNEGITVDNPFFELIKIFRKKRTNNTEILDYVKKYGFLISSDSNYERVEDFIRQGKKITELWKKNEQIQNVKIDDLKKWLRAEKFFLDKSLTVINVYQGNTFSPEVYFEESIREINMNPEAFSYAGFRYITREISSNVKNLAIGSEKVVKTSTSAEIGEEKIRLRNPFLEPPNLLTALYLYFYICLQESTRICPVCLGPNMRRIDAETCSETCAETHKGRKKRKRMEEKAKNYIVNKYGKSDISPYEILKNERDYIFSNIGKSTPFNKKRIREWLSER